MVVSDKTQKYLNMLEKPFEKDSFYEFIKDLLNLEKVNIVNGIDKPATSEQYKKYIESSSLYAQYEDNKRRRIGVIVIKLRDNKTPANARTFQRNYIAHLLEKYNLDASITAIYSNTDNTWRLSFVKREIAIEVGKLKTKVSPAKRYSYLLGKDEPNHTAKEQLVDFIENNTKKYSVDELEEKFSVEKVTKDFFEKYKENYLKLKEKLEDNEEFVSESKRCDFTSEEFTKKLMGQLVFLYFLQKKGWLGVKLVPSVLKIEDYNLIYNKQDALGRKILEKYYINYNDCKKIKNILLEKYKENSQDIDILSTIFVGTKYDKAWGTGEKRFIRKIFDNCVNRNKNFFDDYLEPFFYDGLNHRRKNQYFSTFNCKVPFLNGGLFEPLDNYMWESANFNLSNDIFAEILDFFDRYNFTMNEEEPLEKDVAVDPEMLGKIFENLLDVKDRKSKGAFYTPREIVYYMCQESLANYLVNKVGVDYNEIKEFIQYGEMIRDVDLKNATKNDYLVGDTIFKNIIKIDEALKNIKIADPAVGSGAFSLGMLNEIVKLRDILTSYMLIYNREKLFDKVYTEEQITNNNRTIYKIKWETIKNCIYAVDVENSAVDITKLRLWLSIVVEQNQNTEPEPLPNLDCKIMQGNSLVDEYAGIKLIDEKFIDELKDRENVKFNDGGKIKVKGKFVEISGNQIQLGDGQKKVQIDDLIKLKQEIYGENDANRKRDILDKIQDVRKELLRLNFAGTNKEKELFELDKSHNKPYFAWMLEFIEVFIENNGFDIVIGNPPYGLLNKKQNQNTSIIATEREIEYYKNNNIYKPAKGGVLNIFRLFICKSFELLKVNGHLSLIFPMAFMCDLSSFNLREYILNTKKIDYIEAFPERDNENKRVFKSAKMSVCILGASNLQVDENYKFPIRISRDKFVEVKNEKTYMSRKDLNIIDSHSLTIPLMNPEEFKIVLKICKDSKRMKEYSKCYTGEIDLSLNKKYIHTDSKYNKMLRGAQVQKYYITNDISQGEILYLDNKLYLKENNSPRSLHHLNRRIVMQGITGVNEKNRLKMTICEKGIFCANSVNYLLIEDDKIEYILGICNSKLINWFFSKLSTNSNVNGYEIDNLPIKIDENENFIRVQELVKELLNNYSNEDVEDKLNETIYEIYNINDEEIEIINKGSV